MSEANDRPKLHHVGGTGDPIVLLHGFGSDRLSWLANQQDLTAAGAVHTLDLPGHGDTPLGGDATPDALAETTLLALDAAGLGPVRLVGHSLGGVVAIHVAARRPERVVSLAVIAPAGLGGAIDADFLRALPNAATAEELEPLLQRLVSRPRLINRHIVARVLRQLEAPGYREGLLRLRSALIASEAERSEAIRTVSAGPVPRLAIWGALDTISPLDRDRLDGFATDALILPAAAHLPHVEEARAVNDRLVRWLDGTG